MVEHHYMEFRRTAVICSINPILNNLKIYVWHVKLAIVTNSK